MNEQSTRSVISDIAFLIALCYLAHPSIAVLDKYWVGGLLLGFAAARGIVKIQKEGRQKMNDVVSTVVSGITGSSGNYPAVSQRNPTTEEITKEKIVTSKQTSIPRVDPPYDKGRMKRISFVLSEYQDFVPSTISVAMMFAIILATYIFGSTISMAAMPK